MKSRKCMLPGLAKYKKSPFKYDKKPKFSGRIEKDKQHKVIHAEGIIANPRKTKRLKVGSAVDLQTGKMGGLTIGGDIKIGNKHEINIRKGFGSTPHIAARIKRNIGSNKKKNIRGKNIKI